MKTKEQIFKMLEDRIDAIANLNIECFEIVYEAGVNEGLEKGAIEMERIEMILSAAHIRRLKK